MSTGSEDRFPLTVGEDTGDAIDVSLSPETTPGVYERRVACLMRAAFRKMKPEEQPQPRSPSNCFTA